MGWRLCWLVLLHQLTFSHQSSMDDLYTGDPQIIPNLSTLSSEIDGQSMERIGNKTFDRTVALTTEGSLGKKLDSLHSESSCEDCLTLNHSYDPLSAELTVNFSCKNYNDPCCSPCSIGDVSLFSYYGSESKSTCLDLLHSQVLPDVDGFRAIKINQSGEVAFSNTATGCYTVRLRSDFKPIPLYSGFFWVHTETNIININHWNTTFFLNPHYKKGTLEVSWQAPLGPHNFANFGLQLWHQKDTKINCKGEDAFGKQIEVIPKTGNIILNKPSYIFSNLSHGWYCVRVTPLDDRCGNLGCQPRASPVMFFQDTRSKRENVPQKAWPFNLLWLLVPCGLIIATVVALCLQRRFKHTHVHKGNKYTKVGEMLKPQECLLVWTPSGPDGNKLKEMVHAFKRVLENHASCKVLDYLDLLSLPQEHREQLLSNPVGWVDAILRKTSIKILLIASEGACQYQNQFRLKNGCNGHSSVIHNNLEMGHSNQLDRMLFPYILRKLQDQPHLSSDYSRIFHISFPSLGNGNSELDGLVTWTRYLIPQHLNTLILKIHGMSEGLTDTVMLQSLEAEALIISALTSSSKEKVEISPTTDSQIRMCQKIMKSGVKIPNGRPYSVTNGFAVKCVDNVDNESDENPVICLKCRNVKHIKMYGSHDSSCETVLDSDSLNRVACICQNKSRRNKIIESEDENFKRKMTNGFVKYRTLDTNTNSSVTNVSSISTDETSDEPSLDSVYIDVC